MRTTTTDVMTVDEKGAEAFAGRVFELITGAALTSLIDVGYRTGLFDAAAEGPATSVELAHRAGLDERHVREWLGAMACGGIFEYEASNETYWLPREHAASLTGSRVENLAALAPFVTMLTTRVPQVADAFRTGRGVPYEAFVPEIHDTMEALWQPKYRDLLVPEILPLAPGLVDRLIRGARAADVACGCGNALVVLAARFPASRFVGYDIDGAAIARARAQAERLGLTNVRFEECDAATLEVSEPFDAVLVFNAVHDQADPAAVLGRIHRALAPGGVFLMDEPRISSTLEDNIGNPGAPFIYAVSTLHCMTVSLAAGGVGLGAAWGEQVARRMLDEAGFRDVAVHDAPGDPTNAIFVSYKPAAG